MGSADGATQKDCCVRHILNRFNVIIFTVRFLRDTDIAFRAILASVLGCYYRVLAAMSTGLPWNGMPTLGLACV